MMMMMMGRRRKGRKAGAELAGHHQALEPIQSVKCANLADSPGSIGSRVLRRSKRWKAKVNYTHMMTSKDDDDDDYDGDYNGGGDGDGDGDEDDLPMPTGPTLPPHVNGNPGIILSNDDGDSGRTKDSSANAPSSRKMKKRKRYSYCKLSRMVLKWPAGHSMISSDLSAIQASGFRSPCIVRNSSPSTPRALGIRLPRGKMTVKRLTKFVGLDHPVKTIDVATQSEGPVYSMKDWVSYFLSPPPRKPLLNVVSLELADTPLQNMVSVPSLVKELDLVGIVWPKNDSNKPKVQLYALMSVANCYTDFHIDFGGSSVWYHVVSGRKVFLLVPPSKGNLLMFEEWASSRNQASVFFAERVNDCQKVELLPGDTLFIPGGWAHCVSTPVDSFVIGGNFLTGYNLSLQLDIWHMEERLKIRRKFRYPLFKPLMWYTAAYYLEVLREGKICLSLWEREGLTSLLGSLESWMEQSSAKLEIPSNIQDPNALLDDLKKEILKGS